MAFLIPPLIEIANITALSIFGAKLVQKIPEVVRAFKEDGEDKVRDYDKRLLDALDTIEKQKANLEDKKREELMVAMMNTVLRLQDTSRASPEHRHVREELAAETRKVIEQTMPKETGNACFRALQNRMQLQCSVCLEIYDTKKRRPLVFPHCGHTFCQVCLEKINRKKVFRCPICRQTKDQLENLRVNHAIMDLLNPDSPQKNDDDGSGGYDDSDDDDDDDDDDEYYKNKKLEKEDDDLAIAASRRYQERRSLRCKACMNKYNRKNRCPYIMSVCGHTVCWDCIERVSGRRSTTCPLCHERNGAQEDQNLNYSVYMLLQEDEDAEKFYEADNQSYFEYGKNCFEYDDLTEDDYGRPIGKGKLGEYVEEEEEEEEAGAGAGLGKWDRSKKKRWQMEREKEDIDFAIALSLSIQEDQDREHHAERREFEGRRRERGGVAREGRWEWEGGREKRREEGREFGRERNEGWMEGKREGVKERRREGERVRHGSWEMERGEREGRRERREREGRREEWNEGGTEGVHVRRREEERMRQGSWEWERGMEGREREQRKERRKEGKRERERVRREKE
ncbi:uncharacterized protein LOC134785337 [Penaeus indicus]|uniref:uncharacterized protein LOC134785337 n=1 Tax=Penaeus indicus TaxID=29960 RepID=UPI00300D73CB